MKLSTEVKVRIKTNWLYQEQNPSTTEECICIAVVTNQKGHAVALIVLHKERTLMSLVPIQSLAGWSGGTDIAHCFHRNMGL